MSDLIEAKGVVIAKRLASSSNGNPRYELWIGNVHCATAPDSSLGYKVKNLFGREARATCAYKRGKYVLESIEKVEG